MGEDLGNQIVILLTTPYDFMLLLGLWQGPQEGIRARVGPGLGRGREGAHLVRNALRAETAWQGLVSCAGSKEMEKDVR